MVSCSIPDLAYIAGFLDGEGTITLIRLPPKKPKARTPYESRYQLNVSLVNTNKDIMVWIHSLVGGYLHPRRQLSVKHKVAWQWYCNNSVAEDFIHQIYPWLKIKKGQAEIALKFRETVNSSRHTPDRLGTPPAVQEIRDTMYASIHVLNKKGPLCVSV